MTFGPGKYDAELTAVKRKCGATSAVLIVFDGRLGPGFVCQTTLAQLMSLPEILEGLAQQIRADWTQVPRDRKDEHEE